MERVFVVTLFFFQERRVKKIVMTKRSNGARQDSEVVNEVRQKRRSVDRSKKWQLTENNPDYTKREAVERLTSIGEAVYCIGCSEVGESGTSHIHAFVVYKNAISLSSLKKLCPRAHFEHCKGSNVQNREYIVKCDNDPYEVGELPLATYDSGIDEASEVVALILNGRSPLEILQEYPLYADYVVKNFKNLNDIHEMSHYGVIPRKTRR